MSHTSTLRVPIRHLLQARELPMRPICTSRLGIVQFRRINPTSWDSIG